MSLTKKLVTSIASLLASGVAVNAQTNGLSSGWVYNLITKHEYALTTTITTVYGTWNDARNIAKNNGGDLVSINDFEEQQWLLNNFGYANLDAYAVGLTKTSPGVYSWVSGESLSFQSWGVGEPDVGATFVMMSNVRNKWNISGGLWDDYTGTSGAQIAGIVERDPPFIPKVKSISKVNNGVNLQVETQAGKLHSLESSMNLVDWTQEFIFPGTANTNVTKIYLPEQTEEKKFYRTKN